MAAPFRRAIVIVMDSAGIGELPDAAAYGDQGSDTLGNIAREVGLAIPTLRALGLGRVAALGSTSVPGGPTSVPEDANLRPRGPNLRPPGRKPPSPRPSGAWLKRRRGRTRSPAIGR